MSGSKKLVSGKRAFWILGGLALLAMLALPFAAFNNTTSVSAASSNCTYTQGYWKNHPSSWPVSSLTIGGVTYTQAQLLKIFDTTPKGDATYILMHQLIAAKLNLAQGADGSALGTTVADADKWLMANKLGSKPSDPARSVGINYSTKLDDFNNGRIGPGHCGSGTSQPTATPTQQPPTATPTQQPTPTATPNTCYDYNGQPYQC